MHLPIPSLLLLLLHPLLPHAHPSPVAPFRVGDLLCDPHPSPHLEYADCMRALQTMIRSQWGLEPPLDGFSGHPYGRDGQVETTHISPTHTPNGVPLSVAAGTCRVALSAASWDGQDLAVVLVRAANLIDHCVDVSPPRGGHTVFGPVRIVVEEVGPAVRAGVL